jgi:hypothetical protein
VESTEPTPQKRVIWPYLAILLAVAGVASYYHPTVKSAEIDNPLSMPHMRQAEFTGAEWSVKRRLEVWDKVSFRNARIERHEGRVSVCGEVSTDGGGTFRRYITTGGGVILESDQGDFEQAWTNTCNMS